MTYPRQSKNIKVCPECGTNLLVTARHCAVCGYQYADVNPKPVTRRVPNGRRYLATILLGASLLIMAMSGLVYLGVQKRSETRATVASQEITATYIATTYVSPTPSPTMTFTPAPPTETPIVDIEYEVQPGDSCLSVMTKFNIDYATLLRKNDINCDNLNIGVVLRFSPPTPTPTPDPSVTPMP